MKGVVFTEFMEMVEARYSPALLEHLVDKAALPSKCAYTAVGTYPAGEMISLVSLLSTKTGAPVPALLKLYGEHLFGRFEVKYPRFFDQVSNAFDFLARVENHIHKEVIKLYPDAELPSFTIETHSPSYFCMVYSSSRPFGDLCEGLIVGCLKHFGETAEIIREDLQDAPLTRVRFNIRKTGD